MAFRLKVFIDSSGLTYSQFADRCGIPRPSLSQIISGRNKKVSDVIIGQIHQAFPDLSVIWLLFGEGPMLLSSGDVASENPVSSNAKFKIQGEDSPSASHSHSSRPSQEFNSLFSIDKISHEIPENLTSGQASSIHSNVKPLSPSEMATQLTEAAMIETSKKTAELKRELDKLRQNPRKVSHITIYYDDSTFETFYPKR